MPNRLSQLKAQHALKAAGLPPQNLTPASSVNNEVWLGDRVVVRVDTARRGRLRREATLAAHLPKGLHYPRVLSWQADTVSDVLVQRRHPGRPLAHVWSTMSDEGRQAAIEQLARQMRRLHSVATPAELPPIDSPQLLDAGAAEPARPLLTAIDAARRLHHVDPGFLSDVAVLAFQSASALEPFTDARLVHGDLTFENLLWDGEHLTILDYEFARGAPADVDLDILLRTCAYPFLHIAPQFAASAHPRDYASVPRWLCETYPELFGHPRLNERLTLYSIAFDMHDLITYPPAHVRDNEPTNPLTRMRLTLEGRSYVARLSAALSRSV